MSQAFHRHQTTTQSCDVRALLHILGPIATTCVIADELGCPHRLAYEARLQSFLAAPAPVPRLNCSSKHNAITRLDNCRRCEFPRVFYALLCDLSAPLKTEVTKMAIMARRYHCSCNMLMKRVFYAPSGVLAEHLTQVERTASASFTRTVLQRDEKHPLRKADLLYA